MEEREGWGRLSAVYHASFSPDGSRLTAGSVDGWLHQWNCSTGKRIPKLPGGVVTHYANAESILAISNDGGIRCLDAESGKAQAPGAAPSDFLYVDQASFSPDCKFVAISDGSAVLVKKTVTGETCGRYMLRRGLASLAFSPDGKTVAIGDYLRGVCLVDSLTGKEKNWLLTQNPSFCGPFVFSSDGSLVAWTEGKSIRIERLATLLDSKGKDPGIIRKDPESVGLEAVLVAKKDSFDLDLGGISPEKYLQMAAKDELPPSPNVDFQFIVTNKAKVPLRINANDSPSLTLVGPGALNVPFPPQASTLGGVNPREEQKPVLLKPGEQIVIPITMLGRCRWLTPGEYSVRASLAVEILPQPRPDGLEDDSSVAAIWTDFVKLVVRGN